MKHLYTSLNNILQTKSNNMKIVTSLVVAFMLSFSVIAETNPTGPFMNPEAYDQFDYESNNFSSSFAMLVDCAADITIDISESTDPSNTGNPTGLAGDATVTYSDMSNGLCPEIITRTFDIDYTDPGTTDETCVQVITVTDTEAPVLSAVTPVIDVQCMDDVPAAPMVSATDNGDGDVTIQFVSTDMSEGDETCQLADAIGTNPNIWSVFLPGLPAGLTDAWILDADGAIFTTFDDGTAHITGRVYASNDPSLVFRMDITAKEKMNWAEWSAAPSSPPGIGRTYKDDAGLAAAGGDLWETWEYYVFDETASVLIGEDGLDGSVLNLVHAPANLHFGWQVGLAANNINANFGISSWFLYSGNLNVNGTGYANVSGNGDINFDAACTPNFEPQCENTIIRTWIAYDDCGNGTSITQTINIMDTTAPELSECPSDVDVDCNAIPDVPVITATDNCVSGDIDVTFSEETIPGSCENNYSIV